MAPPISITYTKDGAEATEYFDYLVVACDPRDLELKDRTALEEKVRTSLTSFTFRTSLYAASRPDHAQLGIGDESGTRSMTPNYAVRFNPTALGAMDGRPYGFRDEVFAHDASLKPDPSGKTWATVYQLEKTSLIGRDRAVVDAHLNKLRDDAIADEGKEHFWIDWKPDTSAKPQPEEKVLVDYFAHFKMEDIQKGLPWAIRDAQGEKNTIYVSSFTCFESVLHIYLYEDMLMKDDSPLITSGKFPKDPNTRFAIVGAGPSGLLFASQHLLKKHYSNFKIFEKADRFGGKTFTFRRPVPTGGHNVPCELGTCYLSPAYEPMWHLFDTYDAGKVVALDKNSQLFRSIIDEKVASNEQEKEDGVEYAGWTLRRNISGPVSEERLKAEKMAMIRQTIMYITVHSVVMGVKMDECMPDDPPPKVSDESDPLYLRVLNALRLLCDRAKSREVDDGPRSRERKPPGLVGLKTLYEALQEEERLFNSFDDIDDLVEDVIGNTELLKKFGYEDYFTIQELNDAVQDVYRLKFGEFLDKYRMEKLRGIFIYAYQVQGYGTIDGVPAYYGMIWITPATMLEKMRQQLNPPQPGTPEAERGTVNIVTKGWLTLWEKIVERDLSDKLCLNSNITSITRAC